MTKIPYNLNWSGAKEYTLPYARTWLRDQTLQLFVTYKIELEEYHSLNKLIESEDIESVALAGELMNKFFKRPKLYPPRVI